MDYRQSKNIPMVLHQRTTFRSRLTLFFFLSFVSCSSADEKFRWNNQGNVSARTLLYVTVLFTVCTVALRFAGCAYYIVIHCNLLPAQYIDVVL